MCGFGLKMLPILFANMVQVPLGDLKGNEVDNHLDDIIMYDADFDHHVALVSAL